MVNPERHKDARPEDLAKASLVTVTNNIGAIARMCASISVRCMCERETEGREGEDDYITSHQSCLCIQLYSYSCSDYLPPYVRRWEEGKQ